MKLNVVAKLGRVDIVFQIRHAASKLRRVVKVTPAAYCDLYSPQAGL
jgi:hypothetical protein